MEAIKAGPFAGICSAPEIDDADVADGAQQAQDDARPGGAYPDQLLRPSAAQQPDAACRIGGGDEEEEGVEQQRAAPEPDQPHAFFACRHSSMPRDTSTWASSHLLYSARSRRQIWTLVPS